LWNKADNRSAYAVTDSPKPPAERITWSFEQIADAANLLVVASGAQKAEALSRAFSGDMELPITSIVELEATSVWVDDLAGAQFKEVSEGQS
jgi:6-phosphogluconolactonase